MEIVDPGLAMMVLILGLFLIIVGIVISGVVYRETREWKRLITSMLDRDSAKGLAESPGETGGIVPQQLALRRQIYTRIFNHMDVAGLLGGGATVVVGILIVLIGLALYS
ncbi:MAG: hypothetical protein IBX67_01575 [Dehalococcoidia bacterium]|nr:hypothetical protein [Dehalococcoidia bacterium]